MRRILAVTVAALIGTGCAAGESAPAHEQTAAAVVAAEAELAEPAVHLAVWAHDARLEAAALAAAARIELATGLIVTVNAPDTMGTGIPLFFSDSGIGEWWGCSHIIGEPGTAGNWIAVGTDTLEAPHVGSHARVDGTVLHEILHQLGAGHLDADQSGALNDPPAAYDLTAADLVLVCAKQPCTRFAPEL